MFILPKAIYILNAIPIKLTMVFSTAVEQQQKNSKICVELQNTLNSKIILRKKDKVWDIVLPDVKFYPKWEQSEQHKTDTKADTQVNGIEQSPEINACPRGQLIYDKGSRNVQWGVKSLK